MIFSVFIFRAFALDLMVERIRQMINDSVVIRNSLTRDSLYK